MRQRRPHDARGEHNGRENKLFQKCMPSEAIKGRAEKLQLMRYCRDVAVVMRLANVGDPGREKAASCDRAHYHVTVTASAERTGWQMQGLIRQLAFQADAWAAPSRLKAILSIYTVESLPGAVMMDLIDARGRHSGCRRRS